MRKKPLEIVDFHLEHLCELQTIIAGYLTQCIDCALDNKLLLDFDHVKGEKLFSISDALKFGVSKEVLEKEMAKCEVRCRHCHILRHAKEKNKNIPTYLSRDYALGVAHVKSMKSIL